MIGYSGFDKSCSVWHMKQCAGPSTMYLPRASLASVASNFWLVTGRAFGPSTTCHPIIVMPPSTSRTRTASRLNTTVLALIFIGLPTTKAPGSNEMN